MSKSLVKTPEGREKLEGWFHTFRAKVPAPTEVRRVDTSFGHTQVLVGGPEDGPPVVLLHGALASSAHVLREVGGLLARFRVYAVDIVGQSVMSADARIPVESDAYGQWLVEVMTALGLARAQVIGVSWGGFVALRLAAVAPERIERLALIVPAGMVRGDVMPGLLRMGLPMMLYQAFPGPGTLKRFVGNLLSNEDAEWTPYLGEAFLHYRMDMRIPPLARPEELARLTAPTLIFGAEEDISFPGRALLRRAPELFRNLQHAELIPNCRHSPPTTEAFRQWMSGRLTRFFSGEPVADRA